MTCNDHVIPIRIIVVSPSGLFREGLVNLLTGPKFQISGESEDIDDACNQCGTRTEPDILVWAPRNSAEFSHIVTQVGRAQARIRRLKSVLIVDSPPLREIAVALKAGVAGILPASISASALHSALELVVLGQHLFPVPPSSLLEERHPQVEILRPRPRLARVARHSNLLPAKPPFGQQLHAPIPAEGIAGYEEWLGEMSGPALSVLSDREKQILRCLAVGQSNKLIARELGIAETTVKVHVKSVLRKMKVANRTQAAVWALSSFLKEDRGIQ
jgi:two-component system, NarL family, nitrate/nitrite response regulator NarL